jgi:predicted negative regulator of RcsB-dependent stress response
LRNFTAPYRNQELSAPQLNIGPVVDAGLPSEINSMDRARQFRDKESTLNEQVRLFTKAKALLELKELDAALQYLERLRQRYPAGPLTIEVKELTAQVLAESHRYGEASQTVSALIRAKIPTRKKAQLYRFLGDLQVKQHRCDSAVESYRAALGLGLSVAESDAAKAGIKTCIP